MAQDNDAKNAMQLALYRLLDEELELLKGKRRRYKLLDGVDLRDPIDPVLLASWIPGD